MKSINDTAAAIIHVEDETSNKSFNNNQLFKLYLSDGRNKVYIIIYCIKYIYY